MERVAFERGGTPPSQRKEASLGSYQLTLEEFGDIVGSYQLTLILLIFC